MTPDLDVTADVTLDAPDGSTVSVRGYGPLVVLSLPSVGTLRSLGGAVRRLRSAVGTASAVDSGVTVDVRVRGVSVARLRPTSDLGPVSRAFSRRLGDLPVELSLGGVARLVVRTLRRRRR